MPSQTRGLPLILVSKPGCDPDSEDIDIKKERVSAGQLLDR
jgi:hypothetical protein